MDAKAFASGIVTACAFPDDEGGGSRVVIQHPHRQRLAGARQVAENLRQLEPQRIVDQRERDGEHAVRLEKPEGFGDSLARIDVGIHAQIGRMAQRRMRIQNAIDDQVILLVRGAEEVPRIVDRQRDAGVVIGALGMIFGAEKRDGGIDFDGIDMGGAHPQRRRHIIAAARADDGDALRRLS